MSRRLLLLGCAAPVLVGCGSSPQSALDPAGPGARAISGHWDIMLWVGGAVWVLVVLGLVLALLRRRRAGGEGQQAPVFVAVAGAVLPAAIIIGVMVQSVLVLQETNPPSTGSETVIEVHGHRYWWEVHYPQEQVVTANEIHIPVGEPVELRLTTEDVIHSLWVPQLGVKTDMVPGQTNTMVLEADEPGTYWGQCAEYCGMQHANMRFLVVAHEPAEFRGWAGAQSEPARAGDDVAADAEEAELVAWGEEVFMSSSCVYCHAVAGTEAQGRAGPDLTHLASRQTLAAGILENNRGNLAAWLIDPQALKEGNQMPATELEGAELQALLAYLESLD